MKFTCLFNLSSLFFPPVVTYVNTLYTTPKKKKCMILVLNATEISTVLPRTVRLAKIIRLDKVSLW